MQKVSRPWPMPGLQRARPAGPEHANPHPILYIFLIPRPAGLISAIFDVVFAYLILVGFWPETHDDVLYKT